MVKYHVLPFLTRAAETLRLLIRKNPQRKSTKLLVTGRFQAIRLTILQPRNSRHTNIKKQTLTI